MPGAPSAGHYFPVSGPAALRPLAGHAPKSAALRWSDSNRLITSAPGGAGQSRPGRATQRRLTGMDLIKREPGGQVSADIG